MKPNSTWLKTMAAMIAGALLTLVAQGLGSHWSRKADAATLDQFARQTAATLVSSMPWTGSGKIRGVAGLGDGHTYIVYTDETIQFYQFGLPPVVPPITR